MENSICRVSGASASGKSMFLMDLMARAIMTGEDNKSEVLIMDAQQSFNILKFSEICCQYMDSGDTSDGQNDHEFMMQQLNRLNILQCQLDNFDKAMIQLAKTLEGNTRIALVVVDSLGLFYYPRGHAAQKEEISLTKESYINSYLRKFKAMVKKFKVSFVYCSTVPDFDLQTDAITTHFIELEKINKDLFKMKLKAKGGKEAKVFYNVNFYGIKYIEGEEEEAHV